MNGDTYLNLEIFYREQTDGELLRERIELIRSLGHIAETLAILNAERARRVPLDREAVVLPFREVRDGGF